ncbi:MAG: FAD-binding domain-containing protein [Alphaproteobacteria bacterium]
MTPFASPAEATADFAQERLATYVPKAGRAYAAGRNFDLGPGEHTKVSGLSPWLRHRLVLETDVLRAVLSRHGFGASEKFVQEVFWRNYFKGWLEHRPEVWRRYRADLVSQLELLEKDASLAARYDEAIEGKTGIACFDAWAQELQQTHYLHNHARMWFASIWIFTLKLPWVLGADFFYRNLLDGDPASNTCSWRWVAGLHTAGKTYLARPANIEEYTRGRFQPEGQLSSSALALEEADLGPRVPPVFDLPDLAGQRVGLLITAEDCAVHRFEGLTHPTALFAWTEPVRRSLRETAKAVDAFGVGAVESAAAAASAHFALPCCTAEDGETAADALARWARENALDCVLTPKMPIGPVRRAVHAAATAHDLRLVEITRDYDQAVWPHARAGFFGLKKKIPSIIADLGLA